MEEAKLRKREEKGRAEAAAIDAVSGKTNSAVGSKRGRMSYFYGPEEAVAKRMADDAVCLYYTGMCVPDYHADNPLFRNLLRAVAAAGTSYVTPKRGYVGEARLQRTCKRIGASDLLMEDTGTMAWVRKVVDRAAELIIFLRNHQWTRAYLRKGELHGERVLQELVPAGTRFGTRYLAVSRLCELCPHLSHMVSHEVFKQWAAGAKVKEASDKFDKSVLDFAWWKAANFTSPCVTLNLYDLMLQLTEEMGALLDEDEQQLSEDDKEQVGEFLKRRWDESLACALHVASQNFNPANQEEGIFLRDRECTKVMKEFVERAQSFMEKYKRGEADGFKMLQNEMLAYINREGRFGTKGREGGSGGDSGEEEGFGGMVAVAWMRLP
ncbi:unnamed protein product [Closterium sp. NIES-53]